MPDTYTLKELYDFEGFLTGAIDRIIEDAGFTSIESQRGEHRTGHRFEVSAMAQGETEETDIDRSGQIYYSDVLVSLAIVLRSPASQRQSHFDDRARLRSILARPGGLDLITNELEQYDIIDIRARETLHGEEIGEEGQDELFTELLYTVKLRIPPHALPA